MATSPIEATAECAVMNVAPGAAASRALSTPAWGGLLLLLACLLGMLWRLEQPSVLASVTAMATVAGLGYASILAARHLGWIQSAGAWIVAFALKLLVAFIIVKFAWVLPLGPFLRSSSFGLTDSNLYDQEAAAMVSHESPGANNLGLWEDYGVVHYTAAIYSIFGVSDLYVAAFNSLLSLVGIMALCGTLGCLDPRALQRWDLVRFGMLMPQLAFYEATPSKEPLTNCALFLATLCLAHLVFRPGRRMAIWGLGLVASCILLGLTRLNAVVMFLAIALVVGLLAAPGWKSRVKVLGAMVILAAVAWPIGNLTTNGRATTTVSQILDLSSAAQNAETKVYQREATGGIDPVGSWFILTFLPHNVTEYVAYAPLKFLVWLYSPYPAMAPDWGEIGRWSVDLHLNYRAYVDSVINLAGLASAWLIVFWSPAIFATVQDARRNPQSAFLVVVVVVIGVLISSTIIVEYRRYRTLVEPLMLALALWGGVHGRPSRNRMVLIALLTVLGGFWLSRTIISIG